MKPETGQIVNRWVFLEPTTRRDYWRVMCNCGSFRDVHFRSIFAGQSKSCGCLSADLARDRIKHGAARTSGSTVTYRTWAGMLYRCGKDKDYLNVAVCNRWHDYRNFLADMGERPAGLTLERKNSLLGYKKSNCRWATNKEQQNNKKSNLNITHGKQTKTLKQWCEHLNLNYKSVHNRISTLGWPAEKALTQPICHAKQSTLKEPK